MSCLVDRRNFLRAAGVMGAGVGLAGLGGLRLLGAEGQPAKDVPLAEGAPNAEKLGWRLGCHAYTFNRFTFFESVDKNALLGLKYMDMHPRQRLSAEVDVSTNESMPEDARQQAKKKLAEKEVTLACFGVCQLSADEATSRRTFEFAKDMGIETLISEPPAEAFDTIERLCEEYSINVAIHNHPRPSAYWDPEAVLKVCQGRGKRIGACADTGHWMRSGLVPLDCVKKLEGRIVSFHFKDLNQAGRDGHDVPWGTGKGDIKGVLTEVHRQGFKGVFSIEYEYNWLDSLPEIAECVKYFDKVAAELAAADAAAAAVDHQDP